MDCVLYFPRIDVNINKAANKFYCNNLIYFLVTILLLPAVLNIIRKFQGTQEGSEFKGKHPLLFSATVFIYLRQKKKNNVETLL